MPEPLIVLPHDHLPVSATDRHATLRNYFCDKDADAVLSSRGWELTLAWSDDEARHVDPQLAIGLAWWGGNTTRSTMALSKRRVGHILSTLYDTWTLHSWSEWLVQQAPSRAASVVVLHVDDHRDVGTPRLFVEPGGWRDPLTGELVKLIEPDSVARAIRSGALGMGSFLTPFLHMLPTAEVRHLCQPPKAVCTLDHRVSLSETVDDLLERGALRPAVRLIPSPGVAGPGCYRFTPDVRAWLDGIGSGPILLHIDMDYFNNRYDGDSDWADRERHLDPPLREIFCKIDELTDALRDANLGERLEDVVIAYSPGFFPAEYWSAATDHLLSALAQIYAR